MCTCILLFVELTLPADPCFRDGVKQSTQPFESQTRDNESSSTSVVPREEGPWQEEIDNWWV